MKKPVIAITAQINYETGDLFCREGYVRQVLNAGGFPVLLPPMEQVHQVAHMFDGFLFSGGGDIDSNRYGEPMIYCDGVSSLRDSCETELITYALSNNKPILAICRGVQILNVAMGGSLYQDLPKQKPSEINHRMIKVGNEVEHSISIVKDTVLEMMLKTDKTMVNSYHHQSIKKVAKELKIAALADDGVVEAVYAPDQKFCLGVQWHPERLDNDDTHNIFSAFITEAKK